MTGCSSGLDFVALDLETRELKHVTCPTHPTWWSESRIAPVDTLPLGKRKGGSHITITGTCHF